MGSNLWTLRGDGQRFENGGADTTTTTLTAVTSGAANTKGSYTQLIASTAFDASGFLLHLDMSTGNRNCLIDIAVGAAGSEQDLLKNFFASFGAFVSWGRCHYIPLRIPAGSRVSARHQCNVGTQAISMAVTLIGTGFGAHGGYGHMEAWGSDTTDSAGATVTPGQNDAKGSYAQIIASTAYVADAIIVNVGAGDFIHAANNEILLDLAVGGVGSEQVIIPNVYFLGDVFEDVYRPSTFGPFPCSIPAGSRIAARCQDTDATVETFDIAISAFSL